MRPILTNALSLNMLAELPGPASFLIEAAALLAKYGFDSFVGHESTAALFSASFLIEALTSDQVAVLLAKYGFESFVGHADTAALFSSLLGLKVEANRGTLTLGPDHAWLIVGQYSGPRLPEGATELPEGASIRWFSVAWSGF